MSSPLVSILVPVYNREHLLRECLESALGQTLGDFELIVVDNASTDETWKVCLEFERKDKRVRVFKNEVNVGPVMNWKRCIDEARGQFGKILFSDDAIEPKFLETAVPFFSDPEVGFVFNTVNQGTSRSSVLAQFVWQPMSGVQPSSRFLEDFTRPLEPFSPGCAIFRLKDLKENLVLEISAPADFDFLSHGAGPDILLFLLTAVKYPKVAFISEPLVFFRHHAGSLSVHGMNGRVREGYQRAFLWFAENYLSKSEFHCMAFTYWWLELRAKRRWVSPKSYYRNMFAMPLNVEAEMIKRLVTHVLNRGAMLSISYLKEIRAF